MPRYIIEFATCHKISPNYVPKGMVEGQVYEVVSEMGMKARNETQARKFAFDGFKPENEWEFGRRLISVRLAKPIIS